MADWKTIYEDKFNESSRGYEEQKKQYEDAMAAEQAALQKRYDTAKANAKDDLEKANQQAYIARVMAEKNMPQRLAAQGITGGMTETTASNIFRNYLNSRNAANTAYTKAAADLESGYMSDRTNIQSGWTQKMADLNAQRQAQALEQAKLAYQIAVEEEERRKREEAEAAARARSYSGRGKGEPTEKSTAEKIAEAIEAEGRTHGYNPIGVQTYQNSQKKAPQPHSIYGNIYGHTSAKDAKHSIYGGIYGR